MYALFCYNKTQKIIFDLCFLFINSIFFVRITTTIVRLSMKGNFIDVCNN